MKNAEEVHHLFPIVEIWEGDLTAFVPSNLISMTDGQIYLSSTLFGEGQKPLWIWVIGVPCRLKGPMARDQKPLWAAASGIFTISRIAAHFKLKQGIR